MLVTVCGFKQVFGQCKLSWLLSAAGIKAMSSVSPALVGGFFYTEPPGKPKELEYQLNLSLKGRKLFHVIFT